MCQAPFVDAFLVGAIDRLRRDHRARAAWSALRPSTMPLAETHEQATSRSRMGSLVGYQGCTATRGSHGKSSRLSACFCMPTSSVEHSSTALLQRVDRPDSAAMAGSSDRIMSVQLRQMLGDAGWAVAALLRADARRL
ncbi:hypothetical protein PaG_00011 [Moesziomyces aphidis]|uniref:Uncharacterized protein n=1 Tax=Moesziomyces aphidis TaxID=84754 RepID=W3VUK6_MOEAP|nr:hypothetical protein PaG_00011 [Moesziomyces aphidis]